MFQDVSQEYKETREYLLWYQEELLKYHNNLIKNNNMKTRIFIIISALLTPVMIFSQVKATAETNSNKIIITVRNQPETGFGFYIYNEVNSYDGNSYIDVRLIGADNKVVHRNRWSFGNERVRKGYGQSGSFYYFLDKTMLSNKKVKKAIVSVLIKYKQDNPNTEPNQIKFYENKFELDTTK